MGRTASLLLLADTDHAPPAERSPRAGPPDSKEEGLANHSEAELTPFFCYPKFHCNWQVVRALFSPISSDVCNGCVLLYAMKIINLLHFWLFHNTGFISVAVVLFACFDDSIANSYPKQTEITVSCPVWKAKGISDTHIRSPLQAILGIVVNRENRISSCFVVWNFWRLFFLLLDSTYLPLDYTNFIAWPLYTSRSILTPDYCWHRLQKTALKMCYSPGSVIFAAKFTLPALTEIFFSIFW